MILAAFISSPVRIVGFGFSAWQAGDARYHSPVSDEARWRNLDEEVAGAAQAHQGLLAALQAWQDGPVGSVLRHSDHAVALVNRVIVDLNAQAAEHLQRFNANTASESSGPSAAASVDALRRSIWSLEMAWAASDWSQPDVVGLPFERWRRVERAHLELGREVPGVDYGLADLSAGFVRRELRWCEMAWRARRPMGLGGLPEAVLALEPAERLGWFFGWIDTETG